MNTATSSTVTGPCPSRRPAQPGRSAADARGERLDGRTAGDQLTGQVAAPGRRGARRCRRARRTRPARFCSRQVSGALRIDQPVLQVARARTWRIAPIRPVGDQLPGQGDGRDAAVVEPDHRADAGRRGPRPRRPPSPRPRPRCWPAASRTARACPPPARRSPSRRACRRACTCPPAATSSRSISARQSVSVAPSRAGPPRRAPRWRSGRTTRPWPGRSGRSKTCGAVRQACEWAAPMKA